ncbi:Long chain acyl-CoA synthetase 7 peroxisomal [Chytriomyces hyalinus]|nr:Long chain acyl-CoA synthetase 7 peroxisomal [Chytriomyces hyalinus]
MVKIARIRHEHVGITALDPEHMHELKTYAKEVPGTNPGDGSATGIYRNAQALKELTSDFPKVKTLHDVFQNGLRINPKGNCLGHRPVHYDHNTGAMVAQDYVWQSYEQVDQRIKDFGCGLVKLHQDVAGKDSKFNLGIYSINNPEYVIADYAVQAFSLTIVALYDTLGPETSEFILNHSEIPIIVTTIDKIPNLVALAPKCPHLKAVIIMDGNLNDTPDLKVTMALGKQALGERGIKLFMFKEVESLGGANAIELRLPKPEDAAAISYTSGTTGTPKGAIILHKNLIAYIRAHFDVGVYCLPTDVHISYLPLAHIYEKGNLNGTILGGGAVGFFRGDTALLLDDISVLKPTVFTSVPRLLNRIYERIIAGGMSGSAFKQALFTRAVNAKLANLKATGTLTHPVWDRLIFGKVKSVLGGRLRAVTSGSAPITPDVLNFLRIAFCCPVIEGYGMTESGCAGTIAFRNDFDAGHVGAPLSCNEVKLVSVPEMKYTANDKPHPRGEIWFRGANVFGGYYKDEEKTRETISEDGWLQTGDIGFIDGKGRVHIIDRKKNIFKLAQGEYVAPEKIENVYIKSNLVSQCYVHGDSLQAELVAVVVPDAEYAIPLARENGVLPASTPNPGPTAPNAPPHPLLKKVCESEKVKALILEDMNRVGKQYGLKGFEYVRAIHLDSNGFSIENSLLTPTFKLKRNEAADRFRPFIDAMYKERNAKQVPAKL